MDFASINLYTYSVSSIANILSSILDDDELALLAAVFAQLGDTLATIAVLRTTSPKKVHRTKTHKMTAIQTLHHPFLQKMILWTKQTK